MDDLLVLPRREAVAFGFDRYFTGRPCAKGHVSERYTASRACLVCSKYKAAEFRQRNPHAAAAAQARYRAKNPGKADEYAAQRRSSNRDAVKEAERRYAAKHPHKLAAKWSARRARERNAVPTWFGELDQFVMAEAADLARRRELATGIRWEVDHCIPLAAREACGLHCAANVQVIPARLNARKMNRMMLTEPGDWLRHGQ